MIVRPIAEGVEVLAPAKLNLFLEVLGKRPDGYHEIETLMVAVDLSRRADVRRRPVGGDRRSGATTRACRPDATNLVVKAAERLRAATGMPAGARDRPAKRPSPRRRGWPAGRATRRRRWWPWIGSGTCGPPPDGWTRWPARSAATWRSSCMPRRRSAAAGASGSRPSRLPRPLSFRPDLSPRRPEHGRRVSATDARPSGPGRSGRSWTPWPTARPIALGRSLFNRLQPVAEALAPDWSRVRDALASLGPSLGGSLDEWQRLGLFRALAAIPTRPVDAARRPRDARTRTGPGRDLRPLSRERLVKEYRLWRSPKFASSSWKTTRAATSGCRPSAASRSTTCSSSAT